MSRYLQQLARHAGLSPPVAPAVAAPVNPPPASPPADVAEIREERDARAPIAGPTLSAASAAPAFASGPQPAAAILVHATAEPPGNRPALSPVTPETRAVSRPEAARSATPVAAPPTAAEIIQQVVNWIAEPERREFAAPVESVPGAPPNFAPPQGAALPEQDGEPPPEPAAVEIAMPARQSKTAPATASRRAGQRPRAVEQPRPRRDAMPDGESPPEYQISIGSIELTIEPPPPAPPAAPPPPARPAPRGTLRTGAYRHYLRATL